MGKAARRGRENWSSVTGRGASARPSQLGQETPDAPLHALADACAPSAITQRSTVVGARPRAGLLQLLHRPAALKASPEDRGEGRHQHARKKAGPWRARRRSRVCDGGGGRRLYDGDRVRSSLSSRSPGPMPRRRREVRVWVPRRPRGESGSDGFKARSGASGPGRRLPGEAAAGRTSARRRRRPGAIFVGTAGREPHPVVGSGPLGGETRTRRDDSRRLAAGWTNTTQI
ncbi:unnamed protein product [Ixodes hexagonus]